ncbi:Thymidylate kinase [Salix suchowensis]|nr:Thymidylate kinase [Salix suchowensis]
MSCHGEATNVKRRGAFIVVEGLDRSGKTTQCAALHERLVESGVVAELIKFPDRTTVIGQMIDSYLKSQSDMDDHLIHLLFSANRWELASSIERQLREGTSIVCDRYAFSGIAFSASKGCLTREKAKERGGYGEERYEKEEMQKKVRQVFRRIEAEMQGQRLQSGGQWDFEYLIKKSQSEVKINDCK